MNWHEQCVVFWTWVRHGRPMTRQWVEDILGRAEELSAEAVIFGTQLGGHVAYESKLSPPIPDMEDDVLAQLCEGGHARDLKIVPKIISTTGGCAVEALEHPDWVNVGSDGERLITLCYNSPFGEFQEAQVREVLAGYPIDGLFFDQLSVSCYCVYCQESFRRTYGREMPRDPDFNRFPRTSMSLDLEDTRLLGDFWATSARRFCRRIRRAIDEVRPGTVYVQNWLIGFAAEVCSDYVDVPLPVRHLSTEINDFDISKRLATAYGGKPVWANVPHAYFHHAKVHTIEHTHLLLMQGAASRSSPVIVDLNASDYNKGRYDELREAMRQVRWTSDALKGSAPVKYAALLHSRYSEEMSAAEFGDSFDGIYDILASQHVPVELVSEKGVQEGSLDGFKVLVLPNTTHLAEATVAAIEEFVENGGGLVATYRSGANDEDGRLRAANPIAELAGITMGSVVAWSQEIEYPSIDAQVPIPSVDVGPSRPYFRYARVAEASAVADGLEDRLLSFFGPWVEVEAAEGTRTGAHILEMDQTMVNMQPYDRRGQFPGEPRWPLVTLRDGSGRVAYVSALLEPEANRSDCYEVDRLLRNIVLWAGGPLPVIAANVPSSVHLSHSRSKDGDRLITVVTNQTTNPLKVSHPARPGSIRYVVPVTDLELRFDTQGRRVKTVETASRHPADLELRQDVAVVKIPRLHVAECLVLNVE